MNRAIPDRGDRQKAGIFQIFQEDLQTQPFHVILTLWMAMPLVGNQCTGPRGELVPEAHWSQRRGVFGLGLGDTSAHRGLGCPSSVPPAPSFPLHLQIQTEKADLKASSRFFKFPFIFIFILFFFF